ncbi:MAG: hypothetical protein DDT36_01641 [Firmicutes bacterium]|nr:hypothetical protein [Bacillota bacterium]
MSVIVLGLNKARALTRAPLIRSCPLRVIWAFWARLRGYKWVLGAVVNPIRR